MCCSQKALTVNICYKQLCATRFINRKILFVLESACIRAFVHWYVRKSVRMCGSVHGIIAEFNKSFACFYDFCLHLVCTQIIDADIRSMIAYSLLKITTQKQRNNYSFARVVKVKCLNKEQ